MNRDGESLLWCLIPIADSFDAEMIFTYGQMGEGNLVQPWLFLVPFLAIDAVGIYDLFHIAIGQCAEL